MGVKRSGKGREQRAILKGNLSVDSVEVSTIGPNLCIGFEDGSNKWSLTDAQLRDLLPLIQHKLDHGTLWQDPAPLKRVRCKVKVKGEMCDAEGYDEECDHLPLAVFWRNENGAIVNEAFDRTEVTDLEYITG